MSAAHSLTKSDALQRAVEHAGSQAAFARLVGVAQPSVWKWLQRGQIGARYALRAEAETGVSRHDLRPDLYPREIATDPPTGRMEPVR